MPLAACRVERSDPHRPRLSLLHVYHGNFHIHFPEEIQLRVQPRRRHEDTETHHRHFPYRHGYRLVLAFLLLLGLRSGRPQFRREAMASVWTFDRIRILGVMQRLALCYGAASIIALTMKHKHIPYLIAGLLTGYFILLMCGNGFAYNETNILSVVDRAILTLHTCTRITA
mgnify:CR=1 FL=1